MTPELRESHVAEIVARHPETAEVFQASRIDFCYRGAATVDRACSDRGLDPKQLLAALTRAIEGRSGASPNSSTSRRTSSATSTSRTIS